jgi:hypothetical protein
MSRSALLRSSLLASALFMLPASFAAADDLVKETASSEVSLQPSGDGYKVVVTNRRFETNIVAAALDSTKKQELDVSPDGFFYQLLEIEDTHENTEGPAIETEEGPAKVKVTAYALSKAGKGRVRFTIEADGNVAKTDGPYLIIDRVGCCDDAATHAIYSLETGAYLFNATGEGDSGQWATLGSEGGGWDRQRVISYHVMGTVDDAAVLAGAPDAAAVINYSTTTNAIQHVLVTVPKKLIDDGKPMDWTPKIALVSKDYPKGDVNVFVHSKDAPDKAYDGMTVRLALDDKTVIAVPIKGDRLDIGHAKLPQGFALQEQPMKNGASQQ